MIETRIPCRARAGNKYGARKVEIDGHMSGQKMDGMARLALIEEK